MRRRSFLLAGAAGLFGAWQSPAQTSLGALVWAQEDGLRVRELPDGPPKQIVSGVRLHRPRFSPSGRFIAYRDQREQVFVIRSDGQGGASSGGKGFEWLPKEDRLVDLGVFSPDGKQFVAERIRERPVDKNGNHDRADLYVAPVAAPNQPERY